MYRLDTAEDREHDIIKTIQNCIGRGAPVCYLEFGERNDGLGFEFSAYGRIFQIVVIEKDE